jgi:hypothetical protein
MPRQQVFLSASSFWAGGRCLCRLRGRCLRHGQEYAFDDDPAGSSAQT